MPTTAEIGIILASFLIAVFLFINISDIGKNRKRKQERTAIKPEDNLIDQQTSTITKSVPRYSSIRVLSIVLIILFLALLITTMVTVVSDILQSQLIYRIAAGELVTMAEATASDELQVLTGNIYLVINLAIMVMFLIWFYRAHRNLPALGASGLKYSPGWAVGGFFIPIWNLFRPYQVANEIWKASEPSYLTLNEDDRKQIRGSALLGWWWALFLLSGFIATNIIRIALRLETIQDAQVYTYALLALDVLLIPAIILAILVVKQIYDRQSQRFIAKSLLRKAPTVNASIELEEKRIKEPFSDDTLNYCSKCGTKLNNEMIYCQKCGHHIPRKDGVKVITMCINHLEREATNCCDNCGRPLCRECLVVLSENRYCYPCVQKLIKKKES